MTDDICARVFISCGQQKTTDEVEVAHKIYEKLHNAGFEPYIAVEEQTLRGVTENIFRRVSESEYFLFVDFKREPLKGGVCRGSLFSHQELAIATFLRIEVLAFRERGVKEDDGLMRFIQANCIEFTDRQLLPDVVAQRVAERAWDKRQRNALLLDRDDMDYDDAFDATVRKAARFFHIKVRNLHQRKMARDCVAYLEGITNLSTGVSRVCELVEFKWRGVREARVTVPAASFRKLDSFHIYEDSPQIVDLGINPFVVDYMGFYEQYRLRGPGRFSLSYVVFSVDFPPARTTFTLDVGNNLRDIQFRRLNQS